MSNHEEFKGFWQAKTCPIVNGIIYPNGLVKILRPKRDDNLKCYIPQYQGNTTLQQLSDDEEIGFTNLYMTSSCKVSDWGLHIYCGESSWGGDGFVAVSYNQDTLKWIAFFDFSNPMIEVECKNSKIVSYSTLGYIWTFDIDTPELVTVHREL